MKTPALLLAAATAFAPVARSAETRPVFPVPFVVEHHSVRSGPGGEELVSETVTDTYGGAFVVSVRPNGLRTIVDFERREMTEVDPAKGAYWTVSFGRMKELRERISRASRPVAARRGAEAAPTRAVRVDEVTEIRSARPGTAVPAGRHLRASAEGTPALDAWVDPRVSLEPRALELLRSFDAEALGGDGVASVPPGELLHALRVRAGGAFPVRVKRPLSERGDSTSEDIVTRLEPLPSFPEKLVKVDGSFRRVPSPLEIVAAFEEEETARSSRPTP